jgi:hypothetical protein
MSSDRFEYSIYQPIIVNVEEFYNSQGRYLNKGGSFGRYYDQNDVNAGIVPTVGIRGPDSDENGLTIYFNKSLEFNEQPYTMEIKNINASLTTSTGYLFELSAPFLRYSIPFLDSTSTQINYIEPIKFAGNKSLPQGLVKFKLRRLSGSNPLPDEADGFHDPYIENPSLSFTIVYKYFSTK